MAAKKKKTGTRRKAAARPKARSRARSDPPSETSLKEISRKLGRDLTFLERQIETASQDAVRHCTRVLRNFNHLLGKLEAAGEAEWRRSNEARLEAIEAVRMLEEAIQPPKGGRTVRKTTRRRKPGEAAAHKRARPATRNRGGTKGSSRQRD